MKRGELKQTILSLSSSRHGQALRCYRYDMVAYANCTLLNNLLANGEFYPAVVIMRRDVNGRIDNFSSK